MNLRGSAILMTAFSAKHGTWFRKIVGFARYLIFIVFFVLSIRLIIAYLSLTESWTFAAGTMVLVGIMILTWRNVLWVLYGFLACIPLVSGFQIILADFGAIKLIRYAPVLSFIFAGIYLSWFTQKLFWKKGGIIPQTEIGGLIDLLSGIVLLSLIMVFSGYPVDFVLDRIALVPVLGHKDPSWPIEASYIMLQGLFFYRILELEIGSRGEWKKVTSILYLHAWIIIPFSICHLVFHIPSILHYGTFGIFSPFDDANSYASYGVCLMFVFLTVLFQPDAKWKRMSGLLGCLLLIFVFLSGSRMAWLATAAIFFAYFIYRLRIIKGILLICTILVPLILINMFPSMLLNSSNLYVRHLGRLVVVKNVVKEGIVLHRLALWGRALKISREHPLTGIGIGTFYRMSPAYEDPNWKETWDPEWRFYENAHNYFFQLGSELGIPALILFLLIIFLAYRRGILALSQATSSSTVLKGLLIGLAAYLMTMITSHPLLLSNQQFLFWFIIAAISIPYGLRPEECGGRVTSLSS